jgi:hypothetical protein
MDEQLWPLFGLTVTTPRLTLPDTMLDFAMTNRQWLASHASADIELTGIGSVRQFLDTART